MRIRLYWLYFFIGLSLVVFFGYQQIQEPLSYDLAPEFDGNDYRNIYEYFIGAQTEYQVVFPFHQRVLVPWMASFINSGDIIRDFQIINLTFLLLSVFTLFHLWRTLGFELKWFFAGFLWLFFHWTGIVRLNAFDPITVDVPIYFFQALFLLIIVKRRFVHLLWLAPIAMIQKESFLALMIILTVYGWWHNRRTDEGFYDLKWILLSTVSCILLKLLLAGAFPPDSSHKSALTTLAYHAKEAIYHPFELVRWLAAMGMAFGPALFLTFFKTARTYRYDNLRNLLIMFSCVYLAFGILAGGDMTRIIFLGFPFIATWVIYELREIRTRHLIILGLLSLPLMMIYKQIPDPAFQWELWQSWYPEFAPKTLVLIILGYVTIAALIIRKYLGATFYS